MIKQYKIDEVKVLVDKLKNKKNLILTNYSGVKVHGLSDLRNKLRTRKAEYKVVKNSLFIRALKEVGYEGFDQYVKGPVGVAFFNEEVGDIAKLLKDFAKEQENFRYTVGVLDNVIYNEDQIKRIADLPSKRGIAQSDNVAHQWARHILGTGHETDYGVFGTGYKRCC